jgi:hypothetical protein
MLGFRFKDDKACTAKKFECIHETFNNDGKERIKLETLPGKGHSVLTLDFVDEDRQPTREALNAVLEYFDQKLN